MASNDHRDILERKLHDPVKDKLHMQPNAEPWDKPHAASQQPAVAQQLAGAAQQRSGAAQTAQHVPAQAGEVDSAARNPFEVNAERAQRLGTNTRGSV